MIAAITILIAISGAALLLILFIRIRDAGKELMENLGDTAHSQMPFDQNRQ